MDRKGLKRLLSRLGLTVLRKAYLIKRFRGRLIRPRVILEKSNAPENSHAAAYVYSECFEISNAFVYGHGITSKADTEEIDLDHSIWFGEFSKTPIFRRNVSPVFELPCDSTVYLAGCGSGNYFHWLLDCLPRLSNAKDLEIKNLLVPRVDEFHRETLEFLGLDDRAVRLHEVWAREVWRAQSLIVPSPLNYCGSPSEETNAFWRGAARKNGILPRANSEKRIYLSRGDANTRRVLNEAELSPLLERFGIEIVECSRLSFREQVQLFSEASLILGPHGAAFSNIIFCDTAASVVELTSDSYQNPCFEYLSASLVMNFQKIEGQAESERSDSDYFVDPGDLERVLGGILQDR